MVPFTRDIKTKGSKEPLPEDEMGKLICARFPYPWKPIIAAQRVDRKVEWRTETRYPLRPRTLWNLWQDDSQLVGVRFNKETCYGIIDIDANSPYLNPEGIAQIRRTLELMGICRSVLIRSSYSGGVHLYLPLPEAVSTFSLAVAIRRCLEKGGFTIRQGQLEVFPNVKSYGKGKDGQFTEYNAHRLPLQPESGSYVLDFDLNPCEGGESLETFFRLWDTAAAKQDQELLHQFLLAARKEKRPSRGGKTHEWKLDWVREMKTGWTGPGQTNHLLCVIAGYGVVFKGLQGDDLCDYIVATSQSLPGYSQWCNHQHEIQARAKSWSKAAGNYYWPLGTRGSRSGNIHAVNQIVPFGSYNNGKAIAAQEKIKQAMKTLQVTGALPGAITSRSEAISQLCGVSKRTLYKYLDLWHPEWLGVEGQRQDSAESMVGCKLPCPEGIQSRSGDNCDRSENNLKDAQSKEVYTSPLMKGFLRPDFKVLDPTNLFALEPPRLAFTESGTLKQYEMTTNPFSGRGLSLQTTVTMTNQVQPPEQVLSFPTLRVGACYRQFAPVLGKLLLRRKSANGQRVAKVTDT